MTRNPTTETTDYRLAIRDGARGARCFEIRRKADGVVVWTGTTFSTATAARSVFGYRIAAAKEMTRLQRRAAP